MNPRQYLLSVLLLLGWSLSSQTLERFPADFTADGQLLLNPLNGGLNVPQLSAADLNNDGLQDLYIFERTGNLHLPFLNTGAPGAPQYTFAPDLIANFPACVNWVLLRDYNGDGAMDLFTHFSTPIQGIKVFTGSFNADDELVFEPYQFCCEDYNIIFFPTGGGFQTQLYVSPVDYPAIDDVDGDGDLDILTFSIGGGYVEYYRNQSLEMGYGLDSLIFKRDDLCWGKFLETSFSEEIILILDGEAELDESMITGESRPVEKREGDRVVAGTVSTDSSLRISVVAVGDDTALAGIQRMVADAQESSSRAQVLADRFAALLFYVAAGAALATFVAWAALGDVDSAVVKTVTVLVIACPHALGLAIPLVIAISTAVSARAGILVKDRLALERMRTIDAVLFDKTGTLTKGAHVVTGVAAADTVDEDRMVAIAGAVESDSEHPLARAITAEAARRGDVPAATDFRARTGRGVDAVVDGEQYSVGGPALLRELGAPVPGEVQRRTDEWVARGAAALYLFHGDGIIGAFALEDEVRPEARQAVDELKAMGIQVVMITGDAQQVADAVGAELGLDRVMAEVLPEDKDRAVSELQAQGLSVAMVGDGVNDAPALARADVGLAIGAGTDVAIESAGVVLASSDPRSVTGVVRLSRASYRKMVQNLAWAAGYNIVAIPLAAGVFAWAGLDLSPAVGAILMSLSTIVVALNAQLLRRVDLQLDPIAEEEVTSASLD